MSDTAVTILVTGLISVTTTIVGFLTMWVKLKYGTEKAADAALKAQVVEDKLDANTLTTNMVDSRTEAIFKQTDGVIGEIRLLISTTYDRVAKLEDQNRDRSHRLLDAINAIHLKLATVEARMSTDTNPVIRPPMSSGDK